MSQIDVVNLTFQYEGSYEPLFENVSFCIDTDWKLGFTGRNGRGKTTFLNLLLKKLEYTGTISSPVLFDYFPFEVPDKRKTTGDVVIGITDDAAQWEIERELSLLGVADEVLLRPFDTLSPGEQTKVLLAALFLRQGHFLLIDEPTNHLDREGRQLVGDYLRTKQGFILVSHDRDFLDRCIDHILSINKSSIEIQKGNFSSWWCNKQRQDAFEADENERLQDEIRKLQTAARRTAGWSDKVEQSKFRTTNSGIKPDRGYIGHKSAKMMKRAKSIEARRENAVEQKSGLLKNIETAEKLAIHSLPYTKPRLIEAAGLTLLYGERAVCENLTFTLERGERVALTGCNGSGKSSLLRLLTGADITHTGRLLIGSGLRISYVPQDTSFLSGGLRDFIVQHGLDESLFKAILRKLDFSRAQFDHDLHDYSAGQKKKVLLAKSLCEPAHLYIWDEPLNFIDVFSRLQIEAVLTECRPTMLFVEHDAAFVDAVATKQVAL